MKKLIISPHADDVTIFIGGIVRKWADEGDEIIIARVTNDDFDSVGSDRESTIIQNKIEAENAYNILGATETVHLGYKSDYLKDACYSELRGKIVKLVRKYRPHTFVSMDTDIQNEDNLDHKIIAQAAAEALWISSFDLHYPEHFESGYLPYSVPERFFYSRNPDSSYECVDITANIDAKINALCEQKTVMKNVLNEPLMRAKAMGISTGIDINSDLSPLIDVFGRKIASSIGQAKGYCFGEYIKNKGLGLLELFL